MGDASEDEPRERTMTRMVNLAGNDKLHKGMNWASIAGVAATAVFGYLSDAHSTRATESIANGAATEIAVLQAWKSSAEGQLAAQAEQIAKLREAVAALRAAEHAQHRHNNFDEVDELLDQAAPAPAKAPETAPDSAGLRRRLLGEP